MSVSGRLCGKSYNPLTGKNICRHTIPIGSMYSIYLSPARRSTLATRKRHPGRDRVPKQREPHLAYFLGPNRRGLAVFLQEVDVCKGMLLTIFCALHRLIKSECRCNSSRQSEVAQSGFTERPLVKAASGCASNYIPAPSKGCQLILRDGELTPFRNHLAPFGRSRYCNLLEELKGIRVPKS